MIALFNTNHHTMRWMCPGCKEFHMISTETWDVTVEPAPVEQVYNDLALYRVMPMGPPRITVHPSVLVYSRGKFINGDLPWDELTKPENVTPTPTCHCWITNSEIQFLDDCTHELAGQTVAMVDFTQE